MRSVAALGGLGFALASGFGWAQQDAPAAQKAEKPTTIKAEARLVDLPVVVRDKKGALVRTLNKPDFVLNVDGKAQPIRYFDKEADLPLTLGLLVDTSMSQHNVLDEERTASEAFLDGMLGTRAVPTTTVAAGGKTAEKPVPDRAFVIQFAHEVELLQDLTDSKPKLKAALKELDSPSFGGNGQGGNGQDGGQGGDNGQGGGQGGGRGGDRGGRGSHGAGTALYDSVFLSADEVMSKQHGRKALVILSDGDDRGSKKSLASSIESAQRADTVIYAIYFKGQGGGGGGGNRGGGFPGGGGRRGGGGGWPGGGGQGGGGGGQGGGGGRGGESSVDGKKVLARMADETGGRMFEVKGKETVGTIYAEIAEELRSQYRLGFTPDVADAAEGYHQVTVAVPSGKNLRVQTRDGYYTGGK